MIKLYGVPGWGSTISEVMLTLARIPYQFINVDGFDQPGPQRAQLQKRNPLCQVPTLERENGVIMTETAAIALMVLDQCPDLAPPVGRVERQQFQRLLIWFVANVYPTFTYADYPERWVPDAPEQLKKSCIEYRKSLYLWFDSQLKATPYALGEQLTLLDVYIVVARTWGPRQEWFLANAPKFTAIADKMCQLPELHKVLKANGII
ncbi:glutathione S-transferase family protein [Enterobacter sp. UNJFSC 003]|uniref:glutathione S-transferase family protein n=1 Tax=Enterobacter sp. UNJFSC 003 TaxID=3122077 RepID=UPI002EAF96E5|nr:glutathione S-transferase family protein [Serratia liquefaciens]